MLSLKTYIWGRITTKVSVFLLNLEKGEPGAEKVIILIKFIKKDQKPSQAFICLLLLVLVPEEYRAHLPETFKKKVQLDLIHSLG